MKRWLLPIVLLFFVFAQAQTIKPFRFAFISDTHIGSPNGGAEEDLRRTVADINSMTDIDFVVVTGDVTELGKDDELKLAKKLLDSLRIRYFIIPGNHDTGWSESGGLSFSRTFGSDKFHFVHNGIHLIGCASGPYVRMSDGHVPRDAVNWLEKELSKIKSGEPIVFLNHYPLDNGLDNWYQVIELLKKQNTLIALCGHGHSNRTVQAEGIPSVMGRSNLRAKQLEGGYNLVDIKEDSIYFTERKPLSKTQHLWKAVALENHHYEQNKQFPRPDFSVNQQYPQVNPKWIYQSGANVISTPVVVHNLVVFGNQNGTIEALDLQNGKRKWKIETRAPIFSSPAAKDEKIIVANADGIIYCLSAKGKILWKFKCDKAVLGSPVIENNVVYIGGSDGRFSAYDLNSGRPIWSNSTIAGPIVSKPVLTTDKIVFGAWDTNLYCLDKGNGKIVWKWNNGSPVINFSPAACIPVIKDDVVYIVAPDRYLSAINLNSGKTLWRTNEATVRESIGISGDEKLIYGKTMQDTIVAFFTNSERPQLAWKMNAGFGYEHVPSMLIEKEGKVFFGTRNGVVYSINPTNQQINWAYKIDNSMVNTVQVLSGKELIASTMDGKVALLQEH